MCLSNKQRKPKKPKSKFHMPLPQAQNAVLRPACALRRRPPLASPRSARKNPNPPTLTPTTTHFEIRRYAHFAPSQPHMQPAAAAPQHTADTPSPSRNSLCLCSAVLCFARRMPVKMARKLWTTSLSPSSQRTAPPPPPPPWPWPPPRGEPVVGHRRAAMLLHALRLRRRRRRPRYGCPPPCCIHSWVSLQ